MARFDHGNLPGFGFVFRSVVSHISGEQNVGSRAKRRSDEIAARAADDGDPPYLFHAVACNADRRRTESVSHGACEYVKRGQLIGKCPDGKLGTNLHASIDGTATVIGTSIRIVR